jgi:hypothetical protein
MIRTPRTVVVGVTAITMAALVAGLAFGVAVAATSNTGGTSIERVNVVRSTNVFHAPGTAFHNVSGASSRITIPAGHHSILLARFTTQQDCNVGDGSPSGSCMVRISIGGAEMQPASGGTIVDSVIAGQAAGTRSAAVDRSSGVLGPGAYTVHVAARMTSPLMVFEITDWHLTVERIDT